MKHLAAGVGWEFSSNPQTDAELKRIGIKTIRCINVDPLPGEFSSDGSFVVGNPTRLLAHFATCRAIGAAPHIIIAQRLHPSLRLKEQTPATGRGIMGNNTATHEYGPTDWARFHAYCHAYFEYVLVHEGFKDATFEVGNEPDTSGCPTPHPPAPARGSAAAYDAYFQLYRNVAQAAVEFEREHPGLKVRVGGAALSWAYSFYRGDFNWGTRFVQDCGEQHVKLDLIGVHYYGNISSLRGEYSAIFPPFVEMLKSLRDARDRFVPGTPIWLTEWGPSYHLDNTAISRVNADHIGAAWCAEFLNVMLEGSVDSALYLVTADEVAVVAGRKENIWGWPSMFVNAGAVGYAYPKAPFHVFEMVSWLVGRRLPVEKENSPLGIFAAGDSHAHLCRILIWNYAARLPESGPAEEHAVERDVVLHLKGAAAVLGSGTVSMRRWLLDETHGDAASVQARGEKLMPLNTALPVVESRTLEVGPHGLTCRFSMPPSSVCLVEFGLRRPAG